MTKTKPQLDEAELRRVAEVTLAHYERSAHAFREGTLDHDVSQNIEALVEALQGPGPHAVLDLGCGPGRDLRHFTQLGVEAVGLDGSQAFVEMAREYSGCEVWRQNFLALDLPDERFDGVYANASLFHVPSQALARVLGELAATLKPGGVLFCSNPHGNNQEGFNQDRYGCYHDPKMWKQFVSAAGFSEVRHYYRPHGLPREQQPWLATVWRKA